MSDMLLRVRDSRRGFFVACIRIRLVSCYYMYASQLTILRGKCSICVFVPLISDLNLTCALS